jgi:signal transduction histidine kinase
VQVSLPTVEHLVAHKGEGWPYLLVSAACLFVANLVAASHPLALLLLMLSTQAFTFLSLRDALLFVVPLAPLVIFAHWLDGSPTTELRDTAIEFPFGILFTAMLAFVLTRFFAQRRRAEDLAHQLATTNAELLAAREREKELATIEERVRIARDIHDGLGHHLTILSIQLQAATKVLPSDIAKVAELLANCRRETQAALGEVRRSVDVMRRSPLDGRTLDVGLLQLVEEFDQHASLRATFDTTGTPVPLPPDAALTLYRAAQEGLTNAQKYAAATAVTVTLAHSPATVRLTVQDHGQGNGPSKGEHTGGGFGLRGLRERAEALGGTLSAGTTGNGFLLALELPVTPAIAVEPAR